MENLSLLIFSRNDIKNLLSLIQDIYDITDDIVVIDSSDEDERTFLDKERSRLKLDKVRVFYVVAIGMTEPLRPYGFSKCKNEWVLTIDTDERINEDLKRGIIRIITESSSDGFAIKRYEEASRSGVTSFFTWQIRLVKKSKATYKGELHEQPKIDGKLSRLPENYCMLHMQELRRGSLSDYPQLEIFERLSYSMYNKKTLEYLSRLMMPDNKEIETIISGKLIRSILLAYEKITLRKPDKEISSFDYFVFNFMRDLAYLIKQNDFRGVLHLFPRELKKINHINDLRRRADGDENFEISKIIDNIGIIKMLGLGDEKTIMRLNKEFINKPQGINLLIQLIKDEYRSRYSASVKN